MHSTSDIHVISGTDQIGYAFRLGKIHLAVQERTFCEFTSACHAGTCPQQQTQDPACHIYAAMAADLNTVFTCIGMRCSEHAHKHFIHDPVFIPDISMPDPVPFQVCQRSVHDLLTYRDRVISADPDNGYCAFSLHCCDCCNCVHTCLRVHINIFASVFFTA